MAELASNNNSSLDDSQNRSINSQSTVRRKLEKFKAKLAELFFSPSAQTAVKAASPGRPNSAILTEPHSYTITNYYYGYKSQLENEIGVVEPVEVLNSKGNGRKSVNSLSVNQDKPKQQSSDVFSSSSMSTSSKTSTANSSSILAESHTGLVTPVHANNVANSSRMVDSSIYETSSLNTNNFDSMTSSTDGGNYFGTEISVGEVDKLIQNNPFINEEITSQISINSNLNTVNEMFEPFLHLIDGKRRFNDNK